MPKIFISYRRDDSAAHAGRLFDRLENHFGQGQVFMDVDNIKPGLDFIQVVEQAVGVCDGLIAVIGREWLSASDPAGTGARRIDDPADLVRLEIASALEREIAVIPVLVQGARMPRRADLPENLKGLANRNALEVSDGRFRTDITPLIEALGTLTSQPVAKTGYVEPLQDSTSGFVGRGRELGELRVALQESHAGQGRMFMLAGEPGIGKTRIAQELAVEARALGAQVLWGYCSEDDGAPPYWPWIQLLRSYVEQTSPQKLAAVMGKGAAHITELVSEIGEKLPELEPPTALHPDQARFRLFDAISGFLKNAGRTQPLVLILDDLQWADRSSLLLLQFLAREMGGSPMLVVGTYRDVGLSRQHPLSETLAELTRLPVFHRALLKGLSQADTRRFVEHATDTRPSRSLVETIYFHTEGNPFFMTEVVRLLSERGELTSPDVEAASGSMIPESVREVVGQRLNRLSEGCNEMLATASIIGRKFNFRLLTTLNDGIGEDLLAQMIDEAVDANMLEEMPGSSEDYRFSHALVREALSAGLSTRGKVGLHARIGSALESLYGIDVPAHANEMAYHFGEAEPRIGPEKLLRYSRLAGERALATHAYEEALVHFQKALQAKNVLPTGTAPAADAEAAELLFGLGLAREGTQNDFLTGPEVLTCFSRAFDYYVSAGDVRRAVDIAAHHITSNIGGELIEKALELVALDSFDAGRLLSRYILPLRADYERAHEVFLQALDIAQLQQDLDLEMITLVDGACVEFTASHYQESLEHNLRAIELSDRVDQPISEAHARYDLKHVLLTMGDLQSAASHASAMQIPAKRSGMRAWRVKAIEVNDSVSSARGDWKAAREFSDQGLELDPRQSVLLGSRVLLEYQVGDFKAGEEYLERLMDGVPWRRSEPLAPVTMATPEFTIPAVVIPLVGQATGASTRFDVAEDIASRALSSPLTLGLKNAVRMGLALMAVQRGNANEATELYPVLVGLRGSMFPQPPFGHPLAVDRALGLLSRTLGNYDEAAVHFEDAIVFCKNAGYLPELAWTRYDYADTLLQHNGSGDHEKARSLLDESLAIASELGMRPLMERVISLLDTKTHLQ
jgi:tetratricopeptide (TPR) repeat protein